MKGFEIDSMPSCGQIRTTDVPRQTTRPRFLVSSENLYGSSGSRKYSVVVSSTKFRSGSNPFNTPEHSRPPKK